MATKPPKGTPANNDLPVPKSTVGNNYDAGTGITRPDGTPVTWEEDVAGSDNTVPKDVAAELVAEGVWTKTQETANNKQYDVMASPGYNPLTGTVTAPGSSTGGSAGGTGGGTATGGNYPEGGVGIKNLEADLTGPQRNAFEALYQTFNGYDLGSLAGQIKTMLVNGYDNDTISLLLQQTDEWKQRFQGNEVRKKNGLAVLSPADYLATEAAYRQVLVAHGAPQGFYDQHSDFAQWIGNDVSAQEIDSRAKTVSAHLDNADPNWLLAAKQFYNIDRSTAWAYFLDPGKGSDLIAKQSAALAVGASAMDQGLSTNVDRAKSIADMGVTEQQAQQGYSQIGSILPTLTGLGNIEKDPYTQTDAENEVFGQMASAQRKRLNLTANETNRFNGGSGAGAQTFGKQAPGYGEY